MSTPTLKVGSSNTSTIYFFTSWWCLQCGWTDPNTNDAGRLQALRELHLLGHALESADPLAYWDVPAYAERGTDV